MTDTMRVPKVWERIGAAPPPLHKSLLVIILNQGNYTCVAFNVTKSDCILLSIEFKNSLDFEDSRVNVQSPQRYQA